MKKTTLFLATLLLVVSTQAQRISNLTIDGITSLVPFAAFNPTNNDASKPGDGQIIYPQDVDLSNVNVTLQYGTDATLDAPEPWPTNWTNTITGIKITSTISPFNWAMYNVTVKTIKPTSLPLEIKTGSGNFNSDSWTTDTEGWAGVCIDKNQSIIRFGSAKRSFMVAFTDAPDSLYYTIKALGTWEGSNNIFDIDGSVDGISWTSIKQYNSDQVMPPSSPAVRAQLKVNNPGYRYIRWIYTTRNSGVGAFNVSLENILVTKDSTSATPTHYANTVKLFPLSSQFLRLESAEEVKSLRLYNITGSLVLEEINPAAEIRVHDLKSGIYIGEIILKNGHVVSKKFIR